VSKKSHGFRSNLELRVAADLHKKGIKYDYEEESFGYVVKEKTYTPDFKLYPSEVFVEVKGRFMPIERSKHLYIKKQHPKLDLRFLFSNAQQKLYKGSKTTYAVWCEKHGFKWAERVIPKGWSRK